MNYRIFESDVNNVKQEDFWRPKMSNESKPISNKHENYIFDKNANITKGINNIAKGEDNKKKLKEYLKEMIRKEIAGAYGGDAMNAEDGSSYINKD